MSRQEFTPKTKAQAFLRSGGKCECGCGRKIVGTPEYHHAVHAAIGGSNDLDNCVVMDAACHRVRTAKKDVPQIAKTKRIGAKRAGIKRKSRPMAGTKASGWKRRMDGTTVRRGEG